MKKHSQEHYAIITFKKLVGGEGQAPRLLTVFCLRKLQVPAVRPAPRVISLDGFPDRFQCNVSVRGGLAACLLFLITELGKKLMDSRVSEKNQLSYSLWPGVLSICLDVKISKCCRKIHIPPES